MLAPDSLSKDKAFVKPESLKNGPVDYNRFGPQNALLTTVPHIQQKKSQNVDMWTFRRLIILKENKSTFFRSGARIGTRAQDRTLAPNLGEPWPCPCRIGRERRRPWSRSAGNSEDSSAWRRSCGRSEGQPQNPCEFSRLECPPATSRLLPLSSLCPPCVLPVSSLCLPVSSRVLPCPPCLLLPSWRTTPGGTLPDDYPRRTTPGRPLQGDHCRKTIPGGLLQETTPGGPLQEDDSRTIIPGGLLQEDDSRRITPGGPLQEDYFRRITPGGLPGGPFQEDHSRKTSP